MPVERGRAGVGGNSRQWSVGMAVRSSSSALSEGGVGTDMARRSVPFGGWLAVGLML